MKRVYAYIIATVLCVAFILGEHYYSLTMEDVVDINGFESQRFLDTSDIEDELNNMVGEPSDDDLARAGMANLTINNTQNDNKELSYTYQINLESISGAYRYTVNDNEKYLVFNARGEASVTVNSNDKIVIYDIPSGVKYIVEQTGGDATYIKKVNNIVGTRTSGTLNKNTTLTFSNTIPVKEEDNSKNPYTADTYTLGIVLFVIALVIFIAIRYVKIRRFE